MLLGISLVLFMVMHLAPGDPTSMRYGLNPEVSGSARDNFARMYDLDEPLAVQYMKWLKRMLSLDFGRSMIDDRPVAAKIASRLPATLLLQVSSLVLVFLIAVPLGIVSAVKRDSAMDRLTTVLVFTGYSIPTFWLALLLILFFGIKLQWLPISGMSPWYMEYLGRGERFMEILRHMVLPLIVTALGSMAALSRYSRSSVIQSLKEPYVLNARARGIPENRVIWVHVLRNALLPIVTIMGLALPALVSGSFIFETIFSWPGMGRLGYEAIMSYDYPVVMGVGVIATFLTLSGILLSDIAYAMVDPRIRSGFMDDGRQVGGSKRK
jgi:peptide/nickel transport system permease protein